MKPLAHLPFPAFILARRLLVLGGGFLLLLAGLARAQTSDGTDNPQAPLSVTANRVFTDEFNVAPHGSRGKDPTTGKITQWRTALWFGSGYARQGGGQGYYADDDTSGGWFASTVNYNAFSVQDGILSITAKPMEVPGFARLHYVSGMLSTIDSFYMDYGYYEVRMKCPGDPGNWTAFFLYPADDYMRKPKTNYTKWEMDFLEILGSGKDKLHVTTHQKEDPKAASVGTPSPANAASESVVTTGDNSDAFHIFGFDKQPGKVDVYRDGKLLLTKPTTSRMTSAGYLCLVLDVGKDKGWAGTPDPAKYPQTLLVDYVRIYKTPSTKIVGGPFSSVQMGDVLSSDP